MAHIQKTVSFVLPDEFEMDGLGAGSDPSSPVTTARGNTSTQDYDGPETVILWIVEDADEEQGSNPKGHIEQVWDKDNYTDMPVPIHLRVEELHADTDENTIKIGIIFGGFDPEPKLYEVRVGPEDQFNNFVRDPSNPQFIYCENSIVADWEAPLVFKGDSKLPGSSYADRPRTDQDIRDLRNSLLAKSDGKVADDMPAALKEEWKVYRQKLRDLPADWLKVPNRLINFPQAPDGEMPDRCVTDRFLNEDGVDEHPLIRIADRTAADNDAIRQLIPIEGIDETEDDLL